MRTRWTYEEPHIPPATENVFRLILFFTIAYLFETIAQFGFGAVPLTTALRFGHHFQPHQILTHIFFSGAPGFSGFLHVLFEILILWSFGSELERTWGGEQFLKFFFSGLLGGGLLSFLIAMTLLPGTGVYGFGGGLAAVMTGYAILWPNRQILFFFFFPLRMKWFILILFVLMAGSGQIGQIILYSGGALGGTLFLYYYVKRGNLYSYTPPSSGKTLREKIADYTKKKRLEKKREEIEKRIRMKEEVDRLLEKISKEGIGSLSRKEKAFLDTASKEL